VDNTQSHPVQAPVVLVGSAHRELGESVARSLGTEHAGTQLQRFPDGEMELVVTGAVRGRDIFVVQPTIPPVGDSLLELLLMADACERAGARTVTAVLPYFGYARQDRRKKEGQPHGARVVANVLQSFRFARVIAVDLHSAVVEGCLGVPVEHLSAAPLLARTTLPFVKESSVVVSPDIGGAKLAEAFATRLKLPLCIVHKSRLSGSTVSVRGVVGDVQGKSPILVDDMISTGGTIVAAALALRDSGATTDVTVVTTHALLVADAVTKLKDAGISRLISTDSLPVPKGLPFEHHVAPLGPLFADAIRRLRDGLSLGDLLVER
jgi:ribose-phosphate pyrophosphokinase